MRRSRVLPVLCAAVLCALASGAGAIEQVPLAKVVPPYIGEGLETAPLPTPRQAQLEEVLLVVRRLEVEATANYSHAATIADAKSLGESLAGEGPAAKLLLGVLGDGGAADRELAELKVMPNAAQAR
jgi:hypothetical protein